MFGLFKKLFGGESGPSPIEEAINNGAFLVDVRTPGEFSTGSVKGAVNIPVDRLGKQLAKFKGKQNIVVFCRSGARSSMAKGILEQNGFKNVVNGKTVQNVKQYVK